MGHYNFKLRREIHEGSGNERLSKILFLLHHTVFVAVLSVIQRTFLRGEITKKLSKNDQI